MKKNLLILCTIFALWICSNFVFADTGDNETTGAVLTITTSTDTWATNTGSTETWATNTWTTETWENWQLMIVTDGSGHSTIIVSGYVAPEVTSWDTTSGNTQTWVVDTWAVDTGSLILPDNTNIDPADEFANALAWMYKNWLTMYNTTWEYRMYDLLTREEAAKMIWQAYSTFGLDTSITKNNSCTFSDASSFNPTLVTHIANVCKRWLFQWANWEYLPKESLSKAQAMAVLIRMIEWKMSYELQTPWREQYYKKWKIIWLTNIDNINEFDHDVTRYEIALMIYRMRTIMESSQMKTLALNAMAWISQTTWAIDSQTVKDNLSTLVWEIDTSSDPELTEAIYWMAENWLTIYKTVSEYKPFETLSRAWAAKVFDKFSDMLGLSTNQEYLPNECNFTDIWWLDTETQTHIVNVCKKWLIKWWNNLYNPDEDMTKSSFIVALIRMFEWKALDETVSPRWKNYFDKAQELWLVTAADTTTFDTPISRYEVALFVYRFNVRYKYLNNLNNNKVSDDVINTVEWSINTLNGKKTASIYVNTNMLRQWALDLGYVEIMWTRYKIVKTRELSDAELNWFRWYGDLFDLASNEKLGTINFMVQNSSIIEWTLRFAETTYKITPAQWTSAYYIITEQ